MSEPQRPSGPQFRADGNEKASERNSTTIVGGRPPETVRRPSNIPRGVEVLIKKATVDADFRQLLLETRDAAAETIGLPLDPAEVLMLKAAPREQLATIIERTNVPTEHRRAFLGTAAAAMLAAISVMTPGCAGSRPDVPSTEGIRPETPTRNICDKHILTHSLLKYRNCLTGTLRPQMPAGTRVTVSE